MSDLSETQFVEKLRAEPGRYIYHEKGTYTLREADGSVILQVPRQSEGLGRIRRISHRVGRRHWESPETRQTLTGNGPIGSWFG